jgi:hypothetical protein
METEAHIGIVDCERCRRRTLPSETRPAGICMAYNREPFYAYDRCLKSGAYEPKEAE